MHYYRFYQNIYLFFGRFFTRAGSLFLFHCPLESIIQLNRGLDSCHEGYKLRIHTVE